MIKNTVTTRLLFSTTLFCGLTLAHANHYHSPHAATIVPFDMSVIDNQANGSYGLIGHDIAKNGYVDLVSFAYSGTTTGKPEGEIYWYQFLGQDNNQAYSWKKHLITKKQHALHGAFMDVDQDGYEDLVFTSNFEVPPKSYSNEGNIWWAKRPANLDAAEWQTYWIGRTPGAHRILAVDVSGTGEKKLIAVPLFTPGKPPLYGPAYLSLFEPTRVPTSPWRKSDFKSQQFHVIHDAVVVPKENGEKGENVLIAAKEGLILISFSKNQTGEWQSHTRVLHATPVDTTNDLRKRDKGFIALGSKQPSQNLSGVTALANYNAGTPFIAAIDYTNQSSFLPSEPWHGDTVSIYLPKTSGAIFSAGLTRKVLEKRSAGGHAIQVVDVNQNGCFDVIAGFRAYPTALVLYQCNKVIDKNGNSDIQYAKQIISERSANAIVIGNWNKNGLPTFATVGYGNEGDPYILQWTRRKK